MSSSRAQKMLEMCGVPQPKNSTERQERVPQMQLPSTSKVQDWLKDLPDVECTMESEAPTISVPSWFGKSFNPENEAANATTVDFNQESCQKEFARPPERHDTPCPNICGNETVQSEAICVERASFVRRNLEAAFNEGRCLKEVARTTERHDTLCTELEQETATVDTVKKQQRVVMVNPKDDRLLPEFFLEDDSSADGDLEGVPDDNSDDAIDDDLQTDAHTGTPHSAPSTNQKKRKISPRDNTRKRSCDPSKWLKTQTKAAYNKGLAHRTPKGKEKKARTMGNGCRLDCKRCDKPRLSEDERKKLFDHFWSLGDHVRHWDFLSRHVSVSKPQTLNTLPERAKTSTKTYFFKVDGRQIRVCKNMFLGTLGINHSWVDSALRKLEKGGNISPDKRGTHKTRVNRTNEDTLNSIRNHIGLIPRVQSHYTRTRSKREYLETGLESIERLYKLYAEWAKDQNVTKVGSLRQYREVFVREFNIGFFLPRKDQCLTCTQWKNASVADREAMKSKYDKHLSDKNTVNTLKREKKAAAENDPNLCVSCFDLQKVLTCPRSEVSVMFYRNKLSIYNFTVFDLHAKQGYCYMWDETQANRGADEIASNLLSFIEMKASQDFTKFCFFSDAPTGQNRNRMVFAMWLYAATKFKAEITHTFLESGHSYSEVDSMHGRIECEAKRKEIFTKDQWYSLILNSKQEGEKYKVIEMTQDRCFNFHDLVEKLYWTLDSGKNKVMWKMVRQVRVDYRQPDTIFFKYGFEENESKIVVNVQREEPFIIAEHHFKRAYDRKIPLKTKKAKDLHFLMTQGVVPHSYHAFYQDLMSNETNEERRSDCDFSEEENDPAH